MNGIELTKVSVDQDVANSNLSSVLNGGSENVIILPPEQVRDPGCREFMLIARFIPE